MLQLNCPGCKHPFAISIAQADHIVTCPKCGQGLRVGGSGAPRLPAPVPVLQPVLSERNSYTPPGRPPAAVPVASSNPFAEMVELASRNDEASRREAAQDALPLD